MKKFVLTDNHPIKQKVAQIFELCEKLGISFRYSRAGYMMVDTDSDQSYYLDDIDGGQPCGTIPHSVEYKLTYEK